MAEAVGLVLAITPLVISALEHYANGVTEIGKWWSYKRELKSLVRILDAEYARFLGTCERILDGLVPAAQLRDLLEHPGGPLWKGIDKKLKIRLQQSYSAYLRSVEDMADAVNELKRKLELGPDGKPKWSDYHSFKNEFKRVKFSLSRRNYEELLKRIEKNNDLLADLTDQNIDLEPARKRRNRSVLQFKAVQEHARNLYSVISKGWTCECAMAHQASLCLDDRLTEAEPELFPEAEATTHTIQFNVLFSVDGKSLSSNASLWQETEIRIFQNVGLDEAVEGGMIDSSTALHESQNSPYLIAAGERETTAVKSTAVPIFSALPRYMKKDHVTVTKDLLPSLPQKGVKFAESSTAIGITSGSGGANSEPPKQSKSVRFAPNSYPIRSNSSYPLLLEDYANLVKIEDLCLAIHQCMQNMKYNQRCLGYLSHQAHYRLGIYLPPKSQIQPQSSDITSLAQLLASRQSNQNQLLPITGNLALSRGDRLRLAMTIASSILQLHKTPWLQEDWDKNDIMINKRQMNSPHERAYVSRSFPSGELEAPARKSVCPVRNLTLFALGKVLTELCLGQPLESLRIKEDVVDPTGKASIFNDWNTVNRLTDTIYSEAGTRYGDAVRRCINCDFDQRSTDLDDDAFRQAVYDGVVAPLEDDVRDFFQR